MKKIKLTVLSIRLLHRAIKDSFEYQRSLNSEVQISREGNREEILQRQSTITTKKSLKKVVTADLQTRRKSVVVRPT